MSALSHLPNAPRMLVVEQPSPEGGILYVGTVAFATHSRQHVLELADKLGAAVSIETGDWSPLGDGTWAA